MSDLMFKGGHRPEGWERLVEVWHSSFEERKEWANLAAGASDELNGLATEAVRRNLPMTDGDVAAARSSVEAARKLAATGEALQNKVDKERRAAR